MKALDKLYKWLKKHLPNSGIIKEDMGSYITITCTLFSFSVYYHKKTGCVLCTWVEKGLLDTHITIFKTAKDFEENWSICTLDAAVASITAAP